MGLVRVVHECTVWHYLRGDDVKMPDEYQTVVVSLRELDGSTRTSTAWFSGGMWHDDHHVLTVEQVYAWSPMPKCTQYVKGGDNDDEG